MDFVDNIGFYWREYLIWLVLFVIIILIFEFRRWHFKWTFKYSHNFVPRQEWYLNFQDYLKWWNSFNDPVNIVKAIQRNILRYLEVEYPQAAEIGRLKRGRARILPLIEKIKDPVLREFLTDPEEWIKPYIKGKRHLFTYTQKEQFYYGISLLYPYFHDLHKRISTEFGVDISPDWERFDQYSAYYKSRYHKKRTIYILKTFFKYMVLIVGIILFIIPFITGDAPFYVLLISMLLIIAFFVSFTGFFQTVIWKKLVTIFNHETTDHKDDFMITESDYP